MPKLQDILQQVVWMGTLATVHLMTASLSAPAFASDIYQYIERDGTVSFTNVPTDTRYRKVVPEPLKTLPTVSRISAPPARLSRISVSQAESSRPLNARATVMPATWREHQAERGVEEAIARHASRQQLHPALVRAVIKAESDFDPLAVSKTGAMGLMQLMPQTAMEVGVDNPYDPEDNIGGGTKYLRYLLDRFDGNLSLALAAYNAGMHRVERHRGVPPIQETREYVTKVLRLYRAFLTDTSRSRIPGAQARPAAGPRQIVASLTGSLP